MLHLFSKNLSRGTAALLKQLMIPSKKQGHHLSGISQYKFCDSKKGQPSQPNGDKESKVKEESKEKDSKQDKAQTDQKAGEGQQEKVQRSFRDSLNEFNIFDKMGEAKDRFDQFRVRRNQKRVEKKMSREIKEREKYDKMSDEEKSNMEMAIARQFAINLTEVDEIDILFFIYYTQSTFWDRIAYKIQLFKCRLFYSKELARKQEIYEALFLAINYNPNLLNQSLPILHNELQKIFEKKIPDYYVKTKWELYKEMKGRIDREFGKDEEFVEPEYDEHGNLIQPEQKEESEEPTAVKDPEEAEENLTEEQVSQKLREFNQFQTQLAIITDEPVVIPTKKNQQVNAETIALARIKKLNFIGWNRTEIVKNFLEGDRQLYIRKTMRHDYFCRKQEMDAYLADKQDINIDTMSEEERLTIFSSAKFDPAEMIRRKLRLTWLRNRKKLGFGYKKDEPRDQVIFDMSVFEEMKKSKEQIKETTSGIKEAYDEQVSQSQTSFYGGTQFLLMEKCLEFIRQYDKEFTIDDLEDFVKRIFERAYTSHLKGMIYELDNICQEQALGYFKAVWNIWSTQKVRPKYHRIWGIEKPVFSASEINSSNQPVFNFQIHCQTNHCLIDNKDGVTLKEGSDERIMRNGYQVVCLFEPTEENEEDQWKIISITPVEKTLLLA